jgi:2-oxoglutarate ferredoxin oxidoreductase subunit beta
MTLSELSTNHSPSWCPGCGNFGIWTGFKMAATKAGWDSKNTSIVAGIGCHGHIINFVKISSFEGLHGRAIPVASGIKYVKPDLNVFVFTGDGDCLGEGGNHFFHAAKRNQNLTVLLHNNSIYGLTTGQTSPTTSHNFHSKSTPAGNYDEPFSPTTLAIAAGATFVARSFAGNIAHLSEMIINANEHKGFAVIDILQSCPTFNEETNPLYFHNNTYILGSDYDPTNKIQAFAKSLEWGEKQIPLGIIYQESTKPPAEDEFSYMQQYLSSRT